MRRTTLSVLALSATLGALPAAAQQALYPPSEQYTIRVEYRRWNPTLEATFRQGLTGTLIDPIADLGLPEDKKTREIHGALQLARGHKIRASQIKIDYDGDTVLNREIEYSGTTYDINERVVTTIKGNYWGGGYEFDFLKRETGFLGVVLGGRLLDVDTIIVAPDSGKREAVSSKTVVPTLGLNGRVYADKVSFGVEANGLYLGDRGYLIDADASARLHFSDRLAGQVGYRYVKARGEIGIPDFAQLELRGLTYGVEVSF